MPNSSDFKSFSDLIVACNMQLNTVTACHTLHNSLNLKEKFIRRRRRRRREQNKTATTGDGFKCYIKTIAHNEMGAKEMETISIAFAIQDFVHFTRILSFTF